MKVANKYELYAYNTAGFSAVAKYDTVLLPKLILNHFYNPQDTFAFVKQYSISKGSRSIYRDPAFKGILSLKQGSEFSIGGAFGGHMISGKTIKKDTTISFGGTTYNNVIVTIQYDDACTNAGNSLLKCATLKEYYAKDIGLIKRASKNALDTIFTTDFELVGYHINWVR